jgi:hypothetical protein
MQNLERDDSARVAEQIDESVIAMNNLEPLAKRFSPTSAQNLG